MPCFQNFLLSLFKLSSPSPRIIRRRVFFLNLKSCSSSVFNSFSSSTNFFSSSTPPHSSFSSSSHLKYKSSFLKAKSFNSSHNSSKLLKSINISFLNIRSLNNKSIHVSKLFSDFNLDFLALSETWYESTSPSLISACSLSYSFLELARAFQNPLSTSSHLWENLSFLKIHFFLFQDFSSWFQIFWILCLLHQIWYSYPVYCCYLSTSFFSLFFY